MSTSFIAKSHLIFALTAALFAVTLLAVGPSFATEVPTNALCPVTPDEPVDPTIFSDYEGQRIYFCCQRCRRQFEASPAKYLPNLVLTTTESTAHGHGDESPEDHHKNTEGQASSMAPPAVSQHADAEDDGHQHDHASDHALENEAGFGNRLLAWLGRFHPVIIHFPIAYLSPVPLPSVCTWFGPKTGSRQVFVLWFCLRPQVPCPQRFSGGSTQPTAVSPKTSPKHFFCTAGSARRPLFSPSLRPCFLNVVAAGDHLSRSVWFY